MTLPKRLVLAAKESTYFFETLRAITPLKLFGREVERGARWQNLRMDVQNRDVKTEKLSILFRVSSTSIFSIQSLALIYTGAGLVMQNSMTVGMLMAFSSYAGTFSGRIFSLIDLFVNLKMLNLHTERLSDIVLEKPERRLCQEIDISGIAADITLKNVRFRYADGEPWVIDGVNITIPAGQSIVLVGPSSCGKTTLCKIILGLLEPVEGEILLGNTPIQNVGISAYRKIIGTVMQDDVLLSGTIRDNISF